MKSIVWFLFSGICLLFSIFTSFSQNEPFKYGKVSLSELEMKNYAGDSNAPAVYLYKYGVLNPSKIEFTMQLRIKILRKEGYNWANFSMPAPLYSQIRGITFNLEDGKIVESQLKSESIFKERLYGNYYQYNLSMPNVKEGSVIDIEFVYYGFPLEWRFQEIIPVQWSELIMPYAGNLQFTRRFFGFEPLAVSEEYRWVAKNMPSFKSEPYMNSINNYITKLEFDYLIASWDDVAKILNRLDEYGELLGPCIFLNGMAKDINSRFKNPEDRLKAAYDTIKIIKWNERKRILAEHSSLNLAFKDKSGNETDINLMLVQLLRKLDIDADPVAMSSRDNGVIQPLRPTPLKLNYSIVRAKINNNTYLLDASEEFAPYYLLPLRALNDPGKLIKFNTAENVEIKTDKKDKTYTIYDLNMDENFNLSGKVSIIKDEYAALDFRNEYKKYNSQEDYFENFTKDKPGINIRNTEIKNIENVYLPIEIKMDLQMNNQIINTGDQFYIYPMFYEQLKENIFKSDTRNFPIDYAYKQEKNIVVTIHLPDNIEIAEIPKSVSVKMPDNGAGFYYKISAANNTIQVNYRLSINKPLFLMNEYPFLKEMYFQIVNKHAEPVILKKKS